MNIPDKLGEVLIALAEDRLLSPLKQVPGLSVLAIVILAVRGEEPLHDSADGVLLPLDEHMNVIRHQAIGVEIEWQLGFLLLEDAGESEVVIVRPKYLSAIIPARDDVIEPTANFDPWFARHDGGKCMLGAPKVNQLKPDPS